MVTVVSTLTPHEQVRLAVLLQVVMVLIIGGGGGELGDDCHDDS